MKRFFAAVAFLVAALPAFAQQATYRLPNGTEVPAFVMLCFTSGSVSASCTGGGGGGGAVTQSGTWNVGLTGQLPAFASTPTVNIGTIPSVAVTGVFWQTTQPISAASLPLPSGAATAAKQPALGTAGTPSADVLTMQGAPGMTAIKTDGSATTQPVSGNVGGYNITVPVPLTVTAGAYTANFGFGGNFSFTAFRTTGQASGVLDYVSLASKGGYTGTVAIYLWTKSPSTVCNNNSAVTWNSADAAYLVPGFPITLTPSAVAGATQTYASQPIVVSTNNQDSSVTTNLYGCAIALGATAPASTSDPILSFAMSRD